MKITEKDVEHVARLARLHLDSADLKVMTRQMDAMLGYVDKLNELDTDEVEPMAHAVPMSNAFREDEMRDSMGIDRVLQNAPESDESCFRVPKVIE